MVKKTKKFAFKKVNKTKRQLNNVQHGGNTYTCTGVLGAGSFGTVLACNNNGNKVAIKFAKKNDDAIKMLNDEIEIYKALESKGFNDNIVKRVTVAELEFNQVDIANIFFC